MRHQKVIELLRKMEKKNVTPDASIVSMAINLVASIVSNALNFLVVACVFTMQTRCGELHSILQDALNF